MGEHLAPGEFVITQGTAAFAPFERHLEASARAGCRGVSVWIREFRAAIEAGASSAGLGRALADHGLLCNDVDAHIVWAGGGDPQPGLIAPQPIEWAIEAGDALAASYVNVVIAGDADYDPERAIDRFGRDAERLLAAGLVPSLEFVPQPISPVDDLSKAWHIVEATRLPQVGVMLDTWHFTRGPSSLAMLDIVPPERIIGLQLSDATAREGADLLHETMHERLLPGEGVAPLVELLSRVAAGGAPAPYTIEIFSDTHNAYGPEEAVARSVAAARRVRDAAALAGEVTP